MNSSSSSLDASSSYQKVNTSATNDLGQASSTTVLEECPICFGEYEPKRRNWKTLECSHKVCVTCFKQIKQSRSTMSGKKHTFVKCPFCQGVSGIQIGTCPNGRMQVDKVATGCEGYEAYGTIRITYNVTHPIYHLYRVAYLPDNEEGNAVLKLMEIGWDRRILFTIGTSVTTGQENVLVWNVHHKTSQSGGSACYGYPDTEYFQRVRSELRQFGIQ